MRSPPLLCYNTSKVGDIMKFKKRFLIPIIVLLCVAVYAIVSLPLIETRTWVLSTAQQLEAPYFIVAHHLNSDVSETPMFEFSKPIELICEAKDGKLILTDKTNQKTYEGTYEIRSLDFGRLGASDQMRYAVVIEGKEGIANISSSVGRIMVMYVDNYSLIFEAV